jgi:hypothetical protein
MDTPRVRNVETLALYDGGPTVVWSPPDWDDGSTSPASAQRPTGAASQPRPVVEVETRRVPAQTAQLTRLAYEVWTKNRVYNLDATMCCFEVIDLASGQVQSQHPFIGARLVGGQRRMGEDSELSFPLPVPGADAVFQKHDPAKGIRLAVTSAVTRVILHVHRVEVRGPDRDQAWGKITRTGP